MKRYDEIILQALLDSLERRKDYGREAGKEDLRSRGIFYRIDRKHLPEYFDTASTAYQTLHEQLQTLEDKDIVSLHWRDDNRGHILEKVQLVREHAPDAYNWLGRRSRVELESELMKICRSWQEKAGPILSGFLDWILGRLTGHESVRKYIDPGDPEGFERLCRILSAIEDNTEDRYLREFSIEVFHDSKMAESLLEKAASVIRRFGPEGLAELTVDEILEEYGIYRNPAWVYMKGYGGFCVREEGPVIRLNVLKQGLGITGSDLEEILWSSDGEDAPRRILTIENLTSFHQWKAEDRSLVIYLGGYAGRRKRVFLRRIYEAYPRAEYLHFGDIDCGGFRIWRALREGTGIPFRTCRMDLDTWKKYRRYGRPLTQNDRKQLRLMMDDPYFSEQTDLFLQMLQAGIKLEQECMTYI